MAGVLNDMNLSSLPVIDNLVQRLRSLDESNFDLAMFEVAGLLGVKLEELGLDYPPQPEPRNFTDEPYIDKKTGEIKKRRKPKRYKRTGRLGSNLTSRPERTAPDVYTAFIGTDVEYSPYVIGQPTDDPGQAWMHQGVWTPLAEQIKANLPAIYRFITDELTRRINSYLA